MNGKFTLSGLFILVIMLGAALTASVSAQTLVVNYDFATATAGTPCTATPLTTAPGVTSTFTTGGTGACTTPTGTAAASPPAFTANANNQAVSVTGFAAGSTNFFRFQLSGVMSFQNYMLFFQTRRSGSGPANADVQYSLDGTTFTTFTTIQPPATTAFSPFTIDLSSVAAIEGQPTVFFRLLGRDGTGSTGTFVIDNFQVQAMRSTAASATISGRITNSRGRGLSYVTVMLSGGSLEDPIYTTTSAFGRYTLPDVPAGDTYILTVSSKRYRFAEPTRVVTVNDNLTDVDFIGEGW